jgi:hypothetical protein
LKNAIASPFLLAPDLIGGRGGWKGPPASQPVALSSAGAICDGPGAIPMSAQGSSMPRPLATALALSAACLAAALPAPSAAAQTPMSASEFESYTTGRTLYFYSAGEAYGVEEYHDGRRVTWSFLDGECREGVWFPQGEQICFVYEDRPVPQCWTFYREADGMRAIFEGGDGSTELYEAGEADEPMMCLGPEVGV